MRFAQEHQGRWPSWADAMAHCAQEIQELWTIELEKHHVPIQDVPGDWDTAAQALFRGQHVVVVPSSFTYTLPDGQQITWDITRALAHLKAITWQTVEIPRDQMQLIVEKNEHDPQRYGLVDPSIPGIAAPIVWEGARMYILIDGTHRTGRALRDGLSFFAHLLTDEGSRDCVLSISDPSLIP
jgi:sirohydrochlorin ferrochelatase